MLCSIHLLLDPLTQRKCNFPTGIGISLPSIYLSTKEMRKKHGSLTHFFSRYIKLLKFPINFVSDSFRISLNLSYGKNIIMPWEKINNHN